MTFVSAIVITRNEASQIRDCLATLAWCDEVVVVDAASDDGTATIAREAGARVIETPDWPGFGPQKQRALEAARGEWVVSLDADERFTPAGIAELQAAIQARSADGFRLPRRSWFLTRFVRHSGWSPDLVLRAARRDQARFTPQAVHERLVVDGAVATLREPILHYSYRDSATVDRKVAQYGDAGALELRRAGRDPNAVDAALRAGFAFFRTWVLRLGFLDGSAGFGIAVMNARTTLRKYGRSSAPRGR